MQAEEELSLPPWEKFVKYRLFPYKLCLHLSLVCLITSLVVIINLAFSGYSRTIWQTSVNILYPEDFTDFQNDNTSPFDYFIYTQDRVIEDANHLIQQYFLLPEVAVNEIDVYNISCAPLNDLKDCSGVHVPEIEVKLTTETIIYKIYSANDTSGFPLSYENIDSLDKRGFFNDLERISFRFPVRSHGTTDSTATNEKHLCFNWLWKVEYDNALSGQIFVSSKPSIQSRCNRLPATSIIYGLSLTITIFAFTYQLLLCKAVWRQLIILNSIQTSTLLLIDEKEFNANSLDKTNAIQRQLRESQYQRRLRDSRMSNSLKLKRKSASYSMSLGGGHDNILNAALSINQHHEEMQGGRSREISDHIHENENEDSDLLNDLLTLSEPNALKGALHSPESRRSSQSSNSIASRQMTLATLDEDLKLLREALDSLTWKDILMIVNLWFVVSSSGNMFALLFAFRIIVDRTDIMAESILKAGLGLACLMYWFSLVQYLEYFPKYYIMISMLKITVPRVSQFLFGVLPLFIGYALLGMICFGNISDKFGDFTETLRTLFSVVNGDIIYDTFYSVDFAGLGGQVYLYLYTLIFTYVVLMTIIAIVEEAFFKAQETKPLTDSDAKCHNNDPLDVKDVKKPSNCTNEDYKRTSDLSSQNTLSKSNVLQDGSQSYASSNVSIRGKRDLPDHLKYLLKNIDRPTNTE